MGQVRRCAFYDRRAAITPQISVGAFEREFFDRAVQVAQGSPLRYRSPLARDIVRVVDLASELAKVGVGGPGDRGELARPSRRIYADSAPAIRAAFGQVGVEDGCRLGTWKTIAKQLDDGAFAVGTSGSGLRPLPSLLDRADLLIGAALSQPRR